MPSTVVAGWVTTPSAPDHGPTQERRLDVVAEHDHLARDRVDLRVGAHARRQPAAEVVAADRGEIAADLVWHRPFLEREIPAVMANDVDKGVELERPTRVGVVAEQREIDERRGHDPAEQGTSGAFLGKQALGPDEPIAIASLAVVDPDAMDHAIALEGVGVRAERSELGVRTVAQVGPRQVGRHDADDTEVVDVDLVVNRREASGQKVVGRRIDGGEGGVGGRGHGMIVHPTRADIPRDNPSSPRGGKPAAFAAPDHRRSWAAARGTADLLASRSRSGLNSVPHARRPGAIRPGPPVRSASQPVISTASFEDSAHVLSSVHPRNWIDDVSDPEHGIDATTLDSFGP